MQNLFLITLATILLLPLIPAFLLYKFLPSKTSVIGPFKGLDVKLTGAFGGYFLLVLTSLMVFFPLLKNKQGAEVTILTAKVDSLQKILNNQAQNSEEWTLNGKIISTVAEQTRVFFDDDVKGFQSTGRFTLAKNVPIKNGKPQLPLALCIFNRTDGYKVIDLDKQFNSADIAKFKIEFNEKDKTINVNEPIDIMSKTKDSVRAVINFLKLNPTIMQAAKLSNIKVAVNN